MKDYLKLLKRLPPALRLRIIKAIEKIADEDLAKLDIKLLSKEHQLYRCRIGKIRILFRKVGPLRIVLDIGFRGDIYKNLNKNL